MLQSIEALCRDSKAATSVEYALIGVLIALPIIGGVSGFGGALKVMFGTITSTLRGVLGGG